MKNRNLFIWIAILVARKGWTEEFMSGKGLHHHTAKVKRAREGKRKE